MDAVTDEPVGASPALAEVLARLYAEFIRYQNQKDLPGIRRCLHSASIAHAMMLRNFEVLFDRFTLAIAVHRECYLGTDGDYAYVRYEQTIEKITGPQFPDTRADNLAVFREEHGVWKLWQCVPLRMEPV
ncbi:MAG: nuclear transport factor 2 family protein [Gammaproteobacteria bacterium]|nr:nuclear transport factor 2 family protein [Gammaproteobacteria bacterium]